MPNRPLSWPLLLIFVSFSLQFTPFALAAVDPSPAPPTAEETAKKAQYEADVHLYTKKIEENPNNEQAQFSLAQAYKGLQQYEQALLGYKTRIGMGGSAEEIWYSKLMLGECCQELDLWSDALQWYLDAYQYNPTRAEPFYKIATYYRKIKQNNLAYFFAEQGATIPYPSDKSPFVDAAVYDYLLDEELSIAAYYTPFRAEGLDAANRLLLNRKAPSHAKDQAGRNILFYIGNIASARIQPLTFELPLIREGLSETYVPLNPSIQRTADGYEVICRTVNYSQKGGGNFKSRDPSDPTWRTRNFFLRYDKAMKLLSQKEIVETTSTKDKMVQGLEDCRLFVYDNVNWFTCSLFNMHPTSRVGEALCKLNDSAESSSGLSVAKMVLLQSPHLGRMEKNWLPFVKEGKIHVIYSYDPFIIYQIDQETGDKTVAVHYQLVDDYTRFRGSAGPIPYDDGYLVVVHEVVVGQERAYIHRFLYLDKDFKIIEVSDPFTFMHQGVEFCSGMTIDHAGKQAVLTIGYEDEKAYFVFVDLDQIRSMLYPAAS